LGTVDRQDTVVTASRTETRRGRANSPIVRELMEKLVGWTVACGFVGVKLLEMCIRLSTDPGCKRRVSGLSSERRAA
jgi:hypothetical protein